MFWQNKKNNCTISSSSSLKMLKKLWSSCYNKMFVEICLYLSFGDLKIINIILVNNEDSKEKIRLDCYIMFNLF